MQLFSNLLKNLQKAPKQVQKYFDPTTNKGKNFWSTDIAKGLVKAQRGVDFAATKPRIDLTSTRKKYNNKAVDFGSAVIEDIVNTPSNLFKSGSRIGRDIESGKIRNPKTLLAGLGEAGSPLLNIATLGVGSSAVKQIGKQSVKEMLKYGTKQGAKYGAGYGTLSGLETGENINNNADYLKNITLQTGAGAVLGGAFGAGTAGAGVLAKRGSKAYKNSPLASENGFIKLDENVGPTRIGDVLKNKKFINNQSSSLREEFRKEFRAQSKSFDDDKFNGWFDYVERYVKPEDQKTALFSGLIGQRGTEGNIARVNKFLKLKAQKPSWKQLDKEADESLVFAEPEMPKSSTVDEVLPVSTKEAIVPEATIPEAEPIKTDDWQSLSAELKDRGTQNLYSIMDEVEKKGYTIEQFADIVDNPNTSVPMALKKQVKLYQDTLGTFKKMYEKKTGKQVGTVEKYMPHVREDTPDVEKVGQTFFDKLDQEFGFGKERKGTMTDYVRDPFYAGQRYIDQVNYQLFRPQIEAARTGRPVEAIIKEDEIIKNIAEAASDPKKLKEMKLLDDLLEKGKAEGKDIIDVNTDYSTRTQQFRDDARKFKMAGIWDESGFAAHKRAENYVGYKVETEVRPALESGDVAKISDIMYKADPEYNIARLQKYMDEGDLNTVEGIVATTLLRKERKQAYDQLTEYLSTHRFHGRLKEDVERKAKDIFILEKRKQDLIDSSLGHIRSMVGRAALGLNIRTSVNNMLETKRAIALGDKLDYSESIKYVADPRNIKGILERYGIKVGQNIKDIVDMKTTGKGKGSKVIEAIDKNIIYGPFNATESWKDALFLRTFENEGMRQGLKGKALVDFVMHRFEYYGHKYGEYGTLGLFTNKWAKTAFQFAQYPMKEAGIYYDMGERATRPMRNRLLKQDLDTKSSGHAASYLAKITTMNVALMATLGSLYGASKSEIFGAVPFNIQPSENGLQVSLSPIMSMGQELFWGIYNAKANAEESGEDLNLTDLASRKARRVIASTVIPAGNQLINKTGIQNFDPTGITDDFFTDSTLSDMERGYNPTVSGNARFLAPQSIKDKLVGLTMGPYATSEARDYFSQDQRPLGANQTADFDTLHATDPQAAINMFKGKMEDRKIEKEEKKMLEKFKNGEISADAFRGTKLGATPVMNGKMTVEDMLAKAQAEDEVYSKIKEIKYGDEYKGIPMNQKEQLLKQAYGFTDQQIEDADMKYIKNTLNSKETALLISEDDNPDFINYYKNELLTLEVAKELERLGKIPDAQALWDSVKMSDPYYQKQEMKKLLEKKIKDTSKLQKSQNKKMTNLLIKYNNEATKIATKPYKRKKRNYIRKSKSISKMLIKPNDLIIKRRKLVKVNFNKL